jgi:hypothetical protein
LTFRRHRRKPLAELDFSSTIFRRHSRPKSCAEVGKITFSPPLHSPPTSFIFLLSANRQWLSVFLETGIWKLFELDFFFATVATNRTFLAQNNDRAALQLDQLRDQKRSKCKAADPLFW